MGKEEGEAAGRHCYSSSIISVSVVCSCCSMGGGFFVVVFDFFGSKVYDKVAAAAVSSVAPSSPFSCQLRDRSSIYAAELQAILFAVKKTCQSHESKFMISFDPLPVLQALEKVKKLTILC